MMDSIPDIALTPRPKRHKRMYRLFLHDVANELITWQDNELRKLIEWTEQEGYKVQKYKTVWQRLTQDGGAYADYIQHNEKPGLYLIRIVKINLLVPPPTQ
jgi:hypothetical protein